MISRACRRRASAFSVRAVIVQHTQIEVRYAETDMMGIVYHGSYLPWLEIGRTALLKAHGLPYRELEAEGFYLPVVDIQLSYKTPAHYDDTITIVTQMSARPSLRIVLDYTLHRGAELIASARSTHVFIDRAGRPVRPPARFVQRMATLFPDTGLV
jgi:acyl-CoA thioester hydrolase